MEAQYSTDTVLIIPFDKSLNSYQTEDYYGKYHQSYAKFVSAKSVEDISREATKFRADYVKYTLRSKIWKGLAYSQLFLTIILSTAFIFMEGVKILPFVMMAISYLFLVLINEVISHFKEKYLEKAQKNIRYMLSDENDGLYNTSGCQWRYNDEITRLELHFPVKNHYTETGEIQMGRLL
mmetsp:Transcript_294/g.324  ORF Transcript_294/g.324 Transcript_294/m.324 type:complete len:180 (-) Transcript_294:206-745(-)